jgi:hypothetical protein
MQLQNTNRGTRRSISPKRTAKARGQSSNRNASASRSYENTTRSFRQTAGLGNSKGAKQGRRSKKDNRSSRSRSSANPANKRRSPVGRGRNTQAKRRAPQNAVRAKELNGLSRGTNKPAGSTKGSSAKRARSRR